MTKPPKYWNKAISYLSSKDKIMRSLIKKYNDTFLTTRRDVFFSLCKSIIGQQISVAAANSVFIKFKKLCKNKINPKTVNKLSSQQLKKCGLSRQKVKGIKELANKFCNKSFNPNLIKNMNDEDAIAYLSTLRQIGRWSAEMILLFTFKQTPHLACKWSNTPLSALFCGRFFSFRCCILIARKNINNTRFFNFLFKGVVTGNTR